MDIVQIFYTAKLLLIVFLHYIDLMQTMLYIQYHMNTQPTVY